MDYKRLKNTKTENEFGIIDKAIAKLQLHGSSKMDHYNLLSVLSETTGLHRQEVSKTLDMLILLTKHQLLFSASNEFELKDLISFSLVNKNLRTGTTRVNATGVHNRVYSTPESFDVSVQCNGKLRKQIRQIKDYLE
ncbi:MAG: hypothetical protein HAW67_07015 [Endozoicomonadaceae bacterium]|nr:hypothetical protein [Endozoicomonadaceae bacterium]